MSNVLAKAWPNEWKGFEEAILRNRQEAIENIRAMIEYMTVKASEKEVPLKVYTTGQIAKYFGVSLTSVNNWINENRFTNVKKVAHKQVKISENSMWRSSSGELIKVKEIVELWERQYAQTQDINESDEKELIQRDIKFFEDKYHGSYEMTLKAKESKTSDEIHDQQEWEYLIKRYEE